MRSRYENGVVEISHKGKKVTTSVGTDFDEVVATADDRTYRRGFVIMEHDSRPDLTSDVFYDTPGNWWVVMHINNINDPLQDFATNRKINLPNA